MSIRAKVSKNFKYIIFNYDNIENPSEEDKTTWARLIEVFNDNLFKTFLDENLKTIEVPWNDMFEFFHIIKNENIEIVYDEFILNKINQNQSYKDFINSLPTSIKPSAEELEVLNKKLKEIQFKRDLTIYQLRDLYKMISIENSANFSVPGAGKTSVELARILINDLDRIIVFVPNELVSDEWQGEINQCFPEDIYKQVVLNGNLEHFNLQLDALLTSKKSIGYVNYAQIQDREKEESLKLFLLNNKTHLVLDESHKIKGGKKPNRNKPSSRGSALLRLALFAERRDILTGTPMPHGIWDLISQMEFLYPYSGIDQSILINEDSPKNAVQGIFSRTTKSDLKNDLPEFKDHKEPVEMKIAQMAFYESVVNFYAREFHGVPLNTITDNVRKAVKRMIELSVDPYNVVEKIRREDDSISDFFKMDPIESSGLDKVLKEGKISNKMQSAITMAEEIVNQGEKVVIWSNFRNPIILLEEQLQHLGAVTLFGGTKDVKESVDLFKNDDETMVLIGNPQKGGEGISLHKACHNAIYLDRDYDAGKYLQSRDRIHRIGLSNPKSIVCNYYFLESVHPGADEDHPVIDERVSRNLRKKLVKMEKLLSDEDLGVYIMTEDQSNEWESRFSNDDLQDGLDWFYSFTQ